MNSEPILAKDAVLQESEKIPEGTPVVKGYNWNQGINYNELLKSYKHSGFQATNFGKAVVEINRMLAARDVPLEEDERDVYEEDEFIQRKYGCTIFFGFTSNIVSSGLRESIRFLVQHKLVDAIVASAGMSFFCSFFNLNLSLSISGGVEEDFIKCLAPTYVGSFDLPGKQLRDKGQNRIGNLLVPNDNYCLFENWLMPLLDEMLKDQKDNGIKWTPSKMIARLGERIDNEESIYFWAAKNKIPVYCPALTDGSLGDMMYFHSFRNPGLVCDILDDLRRINNQAMKAKQSGIIAVGAGLIKHHMCKANCVRDGADFAVYLNTAQEFDGSDSGESKNCEIIEPPTSFQYLQVLSLMKV
jgi:deoxyhypusine synthase